MGQTAARRAAGVVVEMVKEGQSAASPGLNLLIYWPYFILKILLQSFIIIQFLPFC